jgi:hypothetical protein
MYDAFISGAAKPDNTPYSVVAPSYDIAKTNGSSAPLGLMSDKLPWNHVDWVPQAVSDQILWSSVHGAGSMAPPPGPNASQAEEQRAATVRANLRSNLSVLPTTQRENLRALPPSDGDG